VRATADGWAHTSGKLIRDNKIDEVIEGRRTAQKALASLSNQVSAVRTPRTVLEMGRRYRRLLDTALSALARTAVAEPSDLRLFAEIRGDFLGRAILSSAGDERLRRIIGRRLLGCRHQRSRAGPCLGPGVRRVGRRQPNHSDRRPRGRHTNLPCACCRSLWSNRQEQERQGL
jgi:hypothetical protein